METMPMSFDHSTYISPFTWRYGSKEMRGLWSEIHRRFLMRRIWVALAQAQQAAGLVDPAQVADLQGKVSAIDIERAAEWEQETRHDLMAEIRTFAEQCPVGGAVLHWGATSADITDNADVLRLREATALLLRRMRDLLLAFAARIDATADLPTMAFTHIQPAEPTTLGYRFAVYAQDLLEDYGRMQTLYSSLRGKGLKGAVGTQASFAAILEGTGMTALQMEALAMNSLELPYYPIATQTYTRQQDLTAVNVLAGLAASLHKFALDFRILQSPPFGEWAEPFGAKQVGSSAMPFKRNPINTENICSLARLVAALPAVAWDNASQAILERSLDDSANRRIFLAEAYLAGDELLVRSLRIVSHMVIDEQSIQRNMAIYGPFAATERVLMELVARGADRQEGHEWLREASLSAWQALREEGEVNLLTLVAAHERIRHFLDPDEVAALMDASTHTGTAADRARTLAEQIREVCATPLPPAAG
jgi:adenylosuccinate lyase